MSDFGQYNRIPSSLPRTGDYASWNESAGGLELTLRPGIVITSKARNLLLFAPVTPQGKTDYEQSEESAFVCACNDAGENSRFLTAKAVRDATQKSCSRTLLLQYSIVH